MSLAKGKAWVMKELHIFFMRLNLSFLSFYTSYLHSEFIANH